MECATSLCKNAHICEICNKDPGIYSCPRCSRKYCSSDCYKSPEHYLCSESFYQEWVETSLRNKTFDENERAKIIEILKKCNDEDIEKAETSMFDQFADVNIANVDEDVLWQNLSNEEKAKFEAFIKHDKLLEEIIPLKRPWWTSTTLNLVSDVDDVESDTKDNISPRPIYPLNVKKLSDLTSKKPSDCLQYNIINILYIYAFLCRFYNCDLKDCLEDVINSFFIFSPVLSEGKNYYSLEESVQDSIRLILNSDLNIPLDFIKSILNDVSSILHGPKNAKPAMFVLCALHEIKSLLLEMKTLLIKIKCKNKSLRKKLMPAVKKIEYFMSWSSDFENNFSKLAYKLLLIVPELFIDTEHLDLENVQEIIKEKPLIQEIE